MSTANFFCFFLKICLILQVCFWSGPDPGPQKIYLDPGPPKEVSDATGFADWQLICRLKANRSYRSLTLISYA